jgi:hypothetical protein
MIKALRLGVAATFFESLKLATDTYLYSTNELLDCPRSAGRIIQTQPPKIESLGSCTQLGGCRNNPK